MVHVPLVDVSHLASSTSFFSAVLQPLGIEYIKSVEQRPRRVSFGINQDPILHVCQSEAPGSSALVIAAPTRTAVFDFHDCALRANPSLQVRGVDRRRALERNLGIAQDGKFTRAAILDLDGNKIEAIYPDPQPVRHIMYQDPSAVNKFPAAASGIGRVVSWRRDATSMSDVAPRAASHAPSLNDDRAASRQSSVRTISAERESASPVQSESEPRRQTFGGINTSTVVGALLGVAAGAALTYGVVSRSNLDQGRKEPAHAREQARRSTLSEQLLPRSEDPKPAVPRRIAFAYPDRDVVSTFRRDYNDEFEPEVGEWQPQRYLLQGPRRSGSSHHSDGKSDARSACARTKTTQGARGRASSQASKARSSSEVPLTRVTLPVDKADDRRTYRAPSLHSLPVSKSPSSESESRSPRLVVEPERSTYVSAHSRRSPSVASRPRSRAPSSATVQPERTHGSRATNLAPRSVTVPAQPVAVGVSTAQSIISARHYPLPASVAPSHVSARRIPLPRSRASSFVSARELPLPSSEVGSSKANWDDDLDSVVPSDSISCVGSGGSGSRGSRKDRRH